MCQSVRGRLHLLIFSVFAMKNRAILFSLIAVIATLKYFGNLENPKKVVFDEVYYGSICKLYTQKMFSVDAQPPLARMILCSFVNLHSEANNVSWNRIGNELPSVNFAFWIRFLPATCSIISLLVACCIVQCLTMDDTSVAIISMLWLNDPLLILQGRFMLCDSITELLQLLSVLACVRRQWTLSSICVGMAIASHLSSVAEWAGIAGLAFFDHWKMLNDHRIHIITSLQQTAKVFIKLLLIPIAIYTCVWYVHLWMLPNSGPHDHLMSSLFQTSLKGGLSDEISPISHESFVTIKSVHRKCYLSSNEAMYPPLYEDGTTSTTNQVVTCTNHRSPNNHWIVTRGDQWSMTALTGNISHGSTIRLHHLSTMRPLTSVMNAAPISKHKGEVSCLLEGENVESPIDWKLEITNDDSAEYWCNLRHYIRLKHEETNGYLSVTHESLGSHWGNNDLEVVANMHESLDPEDNMWLVEEVKSHHRSIGFINVSFLQKFIEVNKVMVQVHSSTSDHRYSSSIYQWPFAMTSVAYYFSSDRNIQIHLMGNPESWIGGVVSMVTCLVIMVVIAARKARGWATKHEDETYMKICRIFQVCVVGWCLHMLLMFYDDQSKFLYNYLPALVMKHLMHACMACVLYKILGASFLVFYSIYLARVVYVFNYLKPVIYGTSFNRTQLQLYSTWDI